MGIRAVFRRKYQASRDCLLMRSHASVRSFRPDLCCESRSPDPLPKIIFQDKPYSRIGFLAELVQWPLFRRKNSIFCAKNLKAKEGLSAITPTRLERLAAKTLSLQEMPEIIGRLLQYRSGLMRQEAWKPKGADSPPPRICGPAAR